MSCSNLECKRNLVLAVLYKLLYEMETWMNPDPHARTRDFDEIMKDCEGVENIFIKRGIIKKTTDNVHLS